MGKSPDSRFMIRSILPFLTIAGSAHAAILIQDNFNDATAAHINKRIPSTNLVNSSNWTATETAGALKLDGSGQLMLGTNNNRTAGISLGSNYFTTNPGIYELSYTITHPSNYGGSWVGFGFTAGLTTEQNLTDSGNAAGPWLFYRANGDVNVRPGGGTTGNVLLSTTYTAGAPVTFRFVLNTIASQWTFDLYANGVLQDLNGSSAGTSYTYANSNPALSYIAIGTGASGTSGTSTGDNFTFALVPEPSHALMLVASAGLFALRRRR
jgi:hypothetical protein